MDRNNVGLNPRREECLASTISKTSREKGGREGLAISNSTSVESHSTFVGAKQRAQHLRKTRTQASRGKDSREKREKKDTALKCSKMDQKMMKGFVIISAVKRETVKGRVVRTKQPKRSV